MSKATERARERLTKALDDAENMRGVYGLGDIRQALKDYRAALAVVEAAFFHDVDRYACLICEKGGQSPEEIDHEPDCPVAHFEEVAAPPKEQP